MNQWSLSEDKGVLRVASTEEPTWWNPGPQEESESFVTTLGEKSGALVQLGRVGGLGKGERVYAVRFAGDTGYVVTFRRVDPLYTLDLSTPSRPARPRRAEDSRLLRLPAPAGRRPAARDRPGCIRRGARTRHAALALRCLQSAPSGAAAHARARLLVVRGRDRPPRLPLVGAVAAGRAAGAGLQREAVHRRGRLPGRPRRDRRGRPGHPQRRGEPGWRGRCRRNPDPPLARRRQRALHGLGGRA